MREVGQAQAERVNIAVVFTEGSIDCVRVRLVFIHKASAGKRFERVAFEAVPALSVIVSFFHPNITIWSDRDTTFAYTNLEIIHRASTIAVEHQQNIQTPWFHSCTE